MRAHWEIVFRLAYLITRNAADAEDAAQDAMLKSWRALGRFRSSEPLRPWLLRIVANEARNRRRSSGRRAQLALRAQADPASGGAAPSPEDLTVAADERGRLLAELDALPEQARTGAGLPLPARPVGDRDGSGARRSARNGEVANGQSTRAAEGSPWLNSNASCAAWRRTSPGPDAVPRRSTGRAATRAAYGGGRSCWRWSRPSSRSRWR